MGLVGRVCCLKVTQDTRVLFSCSELSFVIVKHVFMAFNFAVLFSS